MANLNSKRHDHPLFPQEANTPVNMQQQNRVRGLLRMQPQGNQASDVMILQQDDNDQKRQFTQVQSTTQEASSSNAGQLFDQVNLRNIKHGGIDRISNLPDDMLHEIMSSLPAQELVRTSTLSTQWRNLWASVPCLNSDINQFGGQREQFCNFVNCLLRLRGAVPLDTFRIRSSEIRDANFWIRYATSYNVNVLEFSEDVECEPFKLKHGIVDFTSRHLKSLVLGNVCLDASIFNPINSACPVLENLEVRDSSMEVPEISSDSLLHLGITNCFIHEDLLISTPTLVSLCIKNPVYRVPMVNTLPSLVEAVITLDEYLHSSDGGGEEDEEEEQDGEEINYSIFDGLSNARSIELVAPQREFTFEMEMLECPMFNNLISLTLGEWCTPDEFSPLLYILWRSPLLANLTLNLNKEVCQFCLEEEPTPFPPVGTFTADHLKKVTVYFQIGDSRVGALLKLLAPIGKSLEDIELVPSEHK